MLGFKPDEIGIIEKLDYFPFLEKLYGRITEERSAHSIARIGIVKTDVESLQLFCGQKSLHWDGRSARSLLEREFPNENRLGLYNDHGESRAHFF